MVLSSVLLVVISVFFFVELSSSLLLLSLLDGSGLSSGDAKCSHCVFLCKQYLNQHADGTHKSLVVELNGETWKQEIAYSHSNPFEKDGCKGCSKVYSRLI